MNRKTITLSLVAFVSVITLSGIALAHPEFNGPRFGPPTYGGNMGYGWVPNMPHRGWQNDYWDHDYKIDRLSERLDLDRNQRKQIQTAYDKSRDEMSDLYDTMRENRRAMRKQMREEGFNPEKYQQLAGKQGKLIAEMIMLRAKLKSQIMEVLDDEQQRMFKKRMMSGYDYYYGMP